MLNGLKLRYYTLIISMFYKFRAYFLNFFHSSIGKSMDTRNWLSFAIYINETNAFFVKL